MMKQKVNNTNNRNMEKQPHLQRILDLFQQNNVETEYPSIKKECMETESVSKPKKPLEKVKNNVTELVFILDRSGSMRGLESDTVGGFNAMIEKQKKQEGKCYVSTVLFDHVCEVLHDRVRLEEIGMMTEEDYTVRGCTALIDAIGGAIHHIGNIHKYARREDVPEHTLFVITTDGMENASRKYTSDRVKKMIEYHKENYGWEFIFIGANIDAVETAANFGISHDRAVNYRADAMGTRVLYDAVAEVACNVRASKSVDENWCRRINDDYNNRE